MKLLLTFSLLLLSALLNGCSSIQVSQDFNPQTDFTKFQSFQWLPADKQTKPKASKFAEKNPLIAQRLSQAIEQGLIAKGKTLTQDQPDGYVTYHLSSLQKVRSSPGTATIGFGTGWGYGRYGSVAFQSSPEVYQYEEGQLIIDILDTQGQLIWRGKATTPLEEHPTPEETTQKINEVVQKVLAQFPPTK